LKDALRRVDNNNEKTSGAAVRDGIRKTEN